MDERNKQEKTRYKLAASMKECMKSAPVDKITVKEIVEGCGVTRHSSGTSRPSYHSVRVLRLL